MTHFSLSDVRVFLCATPIHMHYSFDTLMGLDLRNGRRRKKREIDWDKLHQIRHEHDLSAEE
jgi:hypothetical protein